jgi:hypothetical protein
MDIFVVPVGPDTYELYCEPSADTEDELEHPRKGVLGRLRAAFSTMLKAAEEQEHRKAEGRGDSPRGWMGRLQQRSLAWIAERIAEQRLLWHLRKMTAVVAVHPPDMSFDQVMTLIRRLLAQDQDRHRRWLVIDTLLLIVSGVVAIVPGPNMLAYFFAFRVVGHYFSMRGAATGRWRVSWTGRASAPLAELRGVMTLEPTARSACIHEVGARLHLQRFSTFFERIAIRHS